MLIKLFKCQICDHRFELEVIDRANPKEQQTIGYPIACENCRSGRVEEIRAWQKSN